MLVCCCLTVPPIRFKYKKYKYSKQTQPTVAVTIVVRTMPDSCLTVSARGLQYKTHTRIVSSYSQP